MAATSDDALNLAAPGPRRKRGRPRAIDPALTQGVAEWLEENLQPGIELVHTRRFGWLLRCWDSWLGQNGPRSGWREIDSTPEGGLAAMLLRYQAEGRKRTW